MILFFRQNEISIHQIKKRKMKKFILVKSSFSVIFSLKYTRITVGESSKNKSGLAYKLIDDVIGSKEAYVKFKDELPISAGVVALLGLNEKNVWEIVELVKSDDSLRAEFSKVKLMNGSKLSRFTWMVNKIKNQGFKSFKFQRCLVQH